MNWPCLRLCSRKHLSLYAQRRWERDTSTMNKGWAQTHSGFAIHTCMNTGWIKLLHRDVLTLVCYACVYVWKTLNSASEQSHPGFTMHACMNKVDQILCAEPFQPCKTCKYESTPVFHRHTCSYEYVSTLGTHPSSTLTFDHVQKTWRRHSKSVNIWAHIQ